MSDRYLRIFIAASSKHRARVSEMYELLSYEGHSGYDWTKDPGWEEPERYSPLTTANRDLGEVALSDGVIWLLDEESSHGAPYEIGYADRGGQPVVVFWDGQTPQPGTEKLYAYRHPLVFSLSSAIKQLEFMLALNERRAQSLAATPALLDMDRRVAALEIGFHGLMGLRVER